MFFCRVVVIFIAVVSLHAFLVFLSWLGDLRGVSGHASSTQSNLFRWAIDANILSGPICLALFVARTNLLDCTVTTMHVSGPVDCTNVALHVLEDFCGHPTSVLCTTWNAWRRAKKVVSGVLTLRDVSNLSNTFFLEFVWCRWNAVFGRHLVEAAGRGSVCDHAHTCWDWVLHVFNSFLQTIAEDFSCVGDLRSACDLPGHSTACQRPQEEPIL